MITGFELETAPLNEKEQTAARIIAECLQLHHVGSRKAVTAQHICNSLAKFSEVFRDAKGRPYLNGARVRKIVNFIRTTGQCPRLIASSKGYYVSNDRREITEYITGLRARAQAIEAVAKAMEMTI